MNSRATRVGTFEVDVPTHVTLRIRHYAGSTSQLYFLAKRNADLTVPPLLWPVNCIKTGGHVELPSGPTVQSLYCVYAKNHKKADNGCDQFAFFSDELLMIF